MQNHCFFPQPQFVPPSSYMWTGCDHYPDECRSGFYLSDADSGPLDAPERLPSGSHDSLVIFNRCPSFASVRRS